MRYNEIEEAYRVLSDPSLRAKYDRQFAKAPFNSGESDGASKWNWLLPACGAFLLFFIPKTCDNIERRNNELIKQERIIKQSRLPQKNLFELEIPEIEIPRLDKDYSLGSASEHFNNYDSGVKMDKPLGID